MAKDKTIQQHTRSRMIYFSGDLGELLPRLETLEKETNVSLSRQVAVCVAACIDTLEKDMPNKRSFTLNGCKITP